MFNRLQAQEGRGVRLNVGRKLSGGDKCAWQKCFGANNLKKVVSSLKYSCHSVSINVKKKKRVNIFYSHYLMEYESSRDVDDNINSVIKLH